MDIRKAFTFMFEDEQWIRKLLVTSIVTMFSSLLFIPYLLIWGYQVELMQNVIRGEARPLPVWNQIGDKALKGLKFFVIVLGYFLPLLVALICVVVIQAASALKTADFNSLTAQDLRALVSASLPFICVGPLYLIAVFALWPASLILYAANNRVSDAFRVGQVLGFVRRNAGNYLRMLLSVLVAGLIPVALIVFPFLILGLMVPALRSNSLLNAAVSAAPTTWTLMVAGHLYGQFYRAAQKPPPAPAAPAM
ncbi:MAG: DUF4013 domain-containing protein [Chloroflexi bacterium]|nr:DUF4013 domain-containing protein [Chloroflexota bacterium]